MATALDRVGFVRRKLQQQGFSERTTRERTTRQYYRVLLAATPAARPSGSSTSCDRIDYSAGTTDEHE